HKFAGAPRRTVGGIAESMPHGSGRGPILRGDFLRWFPPAAVDPPVLFGHLADQLFQSPVIPLCDRLDAPPFRPRLGGIKIAVHTKLDLERLVADAAAVKYRQRSSSTEWEDCDRLVARSLAAKEVNPTAFGSGVLIAQQDQLTAA